MELIRRVENNSRYQVFTHELRKNREGSVRVYHSSSNCKLCTLEAFSHFMYGLDEDVRIKLMSKLLERCARLVFITVIDKELMQFLCKTQDVEYCVEIPYGYNKGYQYHILIRNTRHMDPHYIKRAGDTTVHMAGMKLFTEPKKIFKGALKVEKINNSKIVSMIAKREYKTVNGMFKGFKKLLNVE